METVITSGPLDALNYKNRETNFLKLFSDDIKLEFLLLVLKHEEEYNWNISRYLFALSTSPQSDSRMHLFIRYLLKIGALNSSSKYKSSSKHLLISDCLRAELKKFLIMWSGENKSEITNEEIRALLFAFTDSSGELIKK